ncbi:MAG: hypothetical protein ACPGSO_01470 [Vicingaceae bacterium]
MNSIKIYLLPLILLVVLSSPLLAQTSLEEDSFKNEQHFTKMDSVLIETYLTEQDFKDQRTLMGGERIEASFFKDYCADEIYNEEPYHKNSTKSRFWDNVAIDVAVDIVVNSIFLIAAFWQ